jgi:glycosidase
MIAIRKKHAAFGSSSMEWINTGNPAVAVYSRQYDGDTILIFNNLSSSAETMNIPTEFQKTYLDLFAGHEQTLVETFTLQPYSYLWLQIQK